MPRLQWTVDGPRNCVRRRRGRHEPAVAQVRRELHEEQHQQAESNNNEQPDKLPRHAIPAPAVDVAALSPAVARASSRRNCSQRGAALRAFLVAPKVGAAVGTPHSGAVADADHGYGSISTDTRDYPSAAAIYSPYSAAYMAVTPVARYTA